MRVAVFLLDHNYDKSFKLLNGKPLFLHMLEKLVSCKFIDEVYLDSESYNILNYSSYLSYTSIKRDLSFASAKIDRHQLFYNEVKQIKADIYIQILATSPFIKKETIKKAVDVLKNDSRYNSVVLAKKDKQYTWDKNGSIYDRNHIPNSIDLHNTIIKTTGLYAVRGEVAHSKKQRIGDNVYMLEAEPIEAIDVNFPEDFILADTIARGIRTQETAMFRILSKHFSSCIFSDIMHDLGINSVVTGLTLNLPDAKIMGRANTLALRKLKKGEDFKGIYDALKTYEKIREGEIIIVENECPEYAYFGELNANLAIRAGALGTIVSGVTRDIKEVSSLGYPVFSKGYSCKDVRGIATMKSHNKQICIQGININPGDLIFADINGVVVIPQYVETEVLQRALKAVVTEKNVLSKIVGSEDAFKIYEEEGAF